MNEKKILDVTCGSRSIWFNKRHPSALYCDIRREEHHGMFGTQPHKKARDIYVEPDVICDFTALPFEDGSFSLVVFDPPHIQGLSEKSWTRKMYGTLSDDWRDVLREGYRECMRVLKPDGVLIFKWSETQIPARDVWQAIGQKPLFGHHSGKKMGTYWGCFMKLEGGEEYAEGSADQGAARQAAVGGRGQGDRGQDRRVDGRDGQKPGGAGDALRHEQIDDV